MKKRIKREKRYRRHKRIRAKIFGTSEVPRLYVFRSNKHIYAQLVDDQQGKTLFSASDKNLGKKDKKEKTGKKKGVEKKEEIVMAGKVAIAFEVGKLLAKMALEKKIERAVFDRGGYRYHGRIKALADGARDGGLKF